MTTTSTPLQDGEYAVLVTLADGRTLPDSFHKGKWNLKHEDEQDWFSHMWWQWYHGNNSCDCNKLMWLDVDDEDEWKEYPCGETLATISVQITRPDGTVHTILP